ncbi:MAG TPA: OmpA family protein [Candidatus Babeliales bacterium]|nr:OmpA family protein [Candidatus Babeliales bacterium]
MKKFGLLSLVLLVSLPGCGGSRKKDKRNQPATVAKSKKDTRMNIDIPLTSSSSFDEEMGEFISNDELGLANNGTFSDPFTDDFAWVEATYNNNNPCKNIQFEFNSYDLTKNQEENIAHNVALVKSAIEECKFFGDEADLPKVVIEGHACKSAGAAAYNLALSEKRARVLADRFINAGVPQECIEIVGRGSEMPVVVNGVAITGDRTQQAPNRRDEIHIIYS